MSRDDDALVRCFVAAFPSLRPEDVPEANVEDVAEWDSLGALTLIALIEEQFALSIPESALEGLSSYSAVQDYLRGEHRLR